MKTFPAAFTIEKNKMTGSKPVWILRLATGYFIAGRAITIPAFTGSSPWPASTVVTTLAWGKSFGSVKNGISGAIDEYQVSEWGVELIIDPDATINIEDLVVAGLESEPADLYLWFEGCTDPPQLIFPGFVREITDLTDTSVSLSIQDETIKLEKCYIGETVSQTNYPSALAADVGKLIPIPFGSRSKVPAVSLDACKQTTLKTACSAADTSLYFSDMTQLSVGMTILLEAEQVYVSSVGTYTATVTRGYNSTTAKAHAAGIAAVQLKTMAFCPSYRALTALSRVWLRYNDLDLDITSYTTRYTGQSGSQLTGYGSMGMITISPSGMASIANLTQPAVSDTVGVSSSNLPITEGATNTPLSDLMTTSGYQVLTVIATFNNTESGNRAGITLTVAAKFAGSSYDASIRLFNDSNGAVLVLWSQNSMSGTVTVNYTFELGSSYLSYNRVGASIGTSNLPISVELQNASRTIRQTSSSSGSGASVSKSGTVTLTGSMVGEIFGSGKILADMTADSGTPAGICNWILNEAGFGTVTTVGALGVSAFSGVIQEYQSALAWLNKLAFQAWAWFALVGGVPKLISRVSLGSPAAITACRIDSDGKRMLTRHKTDISEIVNRITLLYNRDWTQSGDAAYQSSVFVEDAASQSVHKIQERPELFKFDFVTSGASALAALILADLKARHWIAEVELFLDHIEKEFGDPVQLLDLFAGRVLSAEPTPGSFNAIDSIKLIVRST